MDKPEKFRLSTEAEFGVEEPNSCVIAVIGVAVDIAGRTGYQREVCEAWLVLA